MIRASILGAASPLSGELIRILAMHPDVELVEAQARGKEGIPLTEVHHGLIGDTDLTFTGSVDYSRCNVLFVDAEAVPALDLQQITAARPDLKIILMAMPENAELVPPVIDDTPDDEDFISDSAPDIAGIVYGLPEINRKLLVRGARVAVVPQSFASMALVALFPLAKHLLLSGDISLHIEAPAAIIEETDLNATVAEIELMLREVQRSFNGKVTITTEPSDARRSALMTIGGNCAVSQAQAINLFDLYDDHRFAFVTSSAVGISEVAGTNKCVVSVLRDENAATSLNVVADCRMRGGAGEAVHIMNLMFGLHEKTGLYLKAIDFDKY